MSKKITFRPINEHAEEVIEPPITAIKAVPHWWKKMPSQIEKTNITRLTTGGLNRTMKECIPVFDAITSGYTIKLPCDVMVVDPAQYQHRIIWDVSWEVVGGLSSTQIPFFPVPPIYEDAPFLWKVSWDIVTPPGYSLLFTHPFYQYDVPFLTLPGIVDTDSYKYNVNLPFLLNKDFTGVIEKDTPIAQVIPIKREAWKSEILPVDPKRQYAKDKVRVSVKRVYKSKLWHRKSYK
jgi:hypothetical protein